jgi:transcriptional regulator of aromatic amino acid metabolism
MELLIKIAQFIDFVTNSYPFLAVVFTAAAAFKIVLLYVIITKKTTHAISKTNKIILGVLLGCALQQDSAWIAHILKKVFAGDRLIPIYSLYMRISWGIFILQYQALALFLESLAGIKILHTKKQKLIFSISSVLFLILTILAFIVFGQGASSDYNLFRSICWGYALLPVITFSLFEIRKQLQKNKVPSILRKQLKILIFGMLGPYWILDILTAFPISLATGWVTNSYTYLSLSNVFLNLAVLYCARKMIGLRFLNFHDHVKDHNRFNFMDDFKVILEKFSSVSTLEELGQITQTFFYDSLQVPLAKTKLYIREKQLLHGVPQNTLISQSVPALVENFMDKHNHVVCDFIFKNKILIYDEIDFSNFYEKTTHCNQILTFLDTLNADIFLPVYEDKKLIAYIIIERFSRHDKLYSDVERDEMLIFCSYLGNIINLIQNKSLDMLIEQSKELKEELFKKHQLIMQYKESIRSFIRTNKQRTIGIIFYKNYKFVFGNQAAQDIIQINPNYQEGHHITKALKKIVANVENFNTQQTIFTKDSQNNTIILSGVPHLEQKNIIITAYYPEMSDILKQHIDYLKDPSEWDYLLYLETTDAGKLINQLIPSASETIVSFKINLFKAALSAKQLLIDVPERDTRSIMELLHHISLRETLHIVELKHEDKNNEIAIKLFGINPLFNGHNSEPPLLEKLNNNDTLCIQNVHFLTQESQERLADFLRYGYFKMLKSDHRIPSDVRIICSTNQNLEHLTQEKKFNPQLFELFKETTLTLPALHSLPEHEVSYLAEAFGEQAIQDKTYKKLLELTPRDSHKLIHTRPTSLCELKEKVQKLLQHKSKKNDIHLETQFNPTFDMTDPELIQAARLGKYALKDQKTMALLWHKFKNQNHIATFLGVNRSSVNRRCKEYNLQ